MIISKSVSLLGLTLVIGASAYWKPNPVQFHIPVNDSVSQISLYPRDGSVDIWSASTMKAFLQDPAAHPVAIVAMYLHWCPHCQRLVPEWSAVADAYKSTKGIRIAAINCADKVNMKECEKVSVNGYPAIMCFGCSQSSQDLCKGDPCEIQSGYDFDGSISFGERVEGWISNVSKGALQPSHKLKMVKHQARKVLVIGPPGTPGWIPAQFLPPSKRIADAMRCLLSVLWEKNDPGSALFVLRFLDRVFSANDKLCHYRDLSAWAGEAIKKLEVSLRGEKEQKPDVRHLVGDFAKKMNILNLEEEPLFPKYSEGKLATPDPSVGYQTCLTPTCAMWTFLHVVTAAAGALGDQGSKQVSSGEVLQFVRGFVSDYLSCRACKEHFLTRFDTCQFGRCDVGNSTDWRGLVLWLWRAHNGVSMRVAAENDNKEDRRFPSFEDCPTCWRPTEALQLPQKTVAGPDVDQSMGNFDDMFNLKETYGWLILMYAGEKTDSCWAGWTPRQRWQMISDTSLRQAVNDPKRRVGFFAGVAMLVAMLPVLTCMCMGIRSRRSTSTPAVDVEAIE